MSSLLQLGDADEAITTTKGHNDACLMVGKIFSLPSLKERETERDGERESICLDINKAN